MKVNPTILSIIGRSTCPAPDLIVLPEALPRADYLAVNDVLTRGLEAKWDRKRKGHVCENAQERLDNLMNTGETVYSVDQDKVENFFPTPMPIISKMLGEVARLQVGRKENRFARALEPSAGDGRIVKKLLVMPEVDEVTAIELNPNRALSIWDAETTETRQRLTVIDGDFLTKPLTGLGFDLIVMNPPFVRGADAKHVLHALERLNQGGILVAIMSAGYLYRQDKNTVALRAIVERHGGKVEALPEGSFKSSGTGVNTVMVSLRAD